MEYYEQVTRTIQSYDSQIETGSKVLDILLSQKKLICVKNQIELTCIADGHRMDFIHAVDLHTMQYMERKLWRILIIPSIV